VGDLDIWLGIVGIEGQRTELRREEDWNNRQRLRTEGENGQNNNLNKNEDLIVLD